MAGRLAAWAWTILSVLDQSRSKSRFAVSIPSDLVVEKGHWGRNRGEESTLAQKWSLKKDDPSKSVTRK
jgi:hypothetical protein